MFDSPHSKTGADTLAPMGRSYLTTPSTGSAPTSRLVTTSVQFRLREDLVAELRAIAEEDCTTLSTVVRRIVTGELRRRPRYSDPLHLARTGARDVNVQAG